MIDPIDVMASLEYAPNTGLLRWKFRRSQRCAISWFRGTASRAGYLYVNFCGKNIGVHRIAFVCMSGRWPINEIDHKNHDKADNRWGNLREATRQQNAINKPAKKNAASGLRGAYTDRKSGKFKAQITRSGRSVHLGLFDTANEAHEACKRAAKEMHGDFFVD